MPSSNSRQSSPPLPELSAALERAAIAEVAASYDQLNQVLFGGVLARPSLRFVGRSQRIGEWNPESRHIELSLSLLTEHGWTVLLEILKHEMAHQYVHEVLELADEVPHGRAFSEVCAARGIDPRATGLPSAGLAEGSHAKILDRVAKLLRLAEGADANEAAAAASAAQRLILKYNLSHRFEHQGPEYGFRHLGTATGRVSEAERILATIVSEYFFVQAIWISVWRPREGKRGQVLEICGEHDNLELASYVHHYLLATAERLFSAYQEQEGTRSRALRREFIAGVMVGFRDRLASQKKKSAAEGLVWVGDAQLSEFFQRRHPDVRWIRTPGRHRPEAWTKGREAGRNIELHQPLREKPHRGPRLLGPKG